MIVVRLGEEKDFGKLPAIEADAAHAFASFASFGLSALIDHPVTPADYYHSLSDGSAVFVACDEAQIVGFALCVTIDGEAHLKEVSVLQTHKRRGIGIMLVDEAITWAQSRKFGFVTLTTYEDIPFNGLFYEKLNFCSFIPENNWPQLRAIRAQEKEAGLDIKPIIAMIRPLSPTD